MEVWDRVMSAMLIGGRLGVTVSNMNTTDVPAGHVLRGIVILCSHSLSE